MSSRIKLEGKTFEDFKVIEYIGGKKYLIQCSICGETKEAYGTNISKLIGVTCKNKKKEVLDLTAQKIGEWTVLKYIGNKKYLCRCSCGVEKEVLKVNLVNGSSTSCGHRHNSYGDITGKKYGDWMVIGKEGYKYKCQCTCGKISYNTSYDLETGKTKSCGHGYNEFEDITGKIFGHWTTLEYIGNQHYKCMCDCENHTVSNIKKADLLSGASTSCGCSKHEKAKETLLIRYGEVAPNKTNNTRSSEQIEAIKDKEALGDFITKQNNLHGYKITTLQLAEKLGIQIHRTLTILHNFELEKLISINPSQSTPELELLDFIKSIYKGKIVERDRSILNGKELDILLPDINIAIEFNGNYWHSDIYKSNTYHQDKTLNCMKKGIRLIHIFEYEWLDINKRYKIMKFISRVLTKNSNNVIYARNTEIKEIENTESREFCNKYHLQGSTNSKINIGTFMKNEIIGVMTFGKPRFNTNYQYELIRLCWKNDISVIGGSEKMFKHFTDKYNPQSIITYCDISKFTGGIYNKLSFTLEDKNKMITSPNYVWVNTIDNKVLSRYQTQKAKLVEQELGTKDQTEDEIMKNNNYIKIYDCGNLKLCWINDNILSREEGI